MEPSQKIALGMFLAVLALLYGSAGLMTLDGIRRVFARRRGAAPAPHSRAYVWLRRAVLVMAAAGIVCMAHG